ncbi:hypothetical protein [Pedobacter sp. UC225_65]|uniref:hypothetical protein n=1 Tax=Pedobacter sp. UC225_65 TaxID=3350173 RepID=UPI00366AB50F
MKLSNTFLFVGLVALGAIIGVFLCNYTYFTFEKEISYFDLFSLSITTVLGIYITVRLGRIFNKENSEKQLLIGEVRESIKLLDGINNYIDARTYSIQTMAHDIKLLNENLHLIENLIMASHCKLVDAQPIRTSIRLFRRTLTGVRGANNSATLSGVQYTSAKRSSAALKQKYFELIFDINKI